MNFDELQNSSSALLCPSCETLQDLSINVSDNIFIHEMIKKKDKLPGMRRPISEQISGGDFCRETQKWYQKIRVIDRGRNKYIEIVTDPETEEPIHCCEEPLDEHFGHGSAKNKKQERNKFTYGKSN